jgi:hypothetical protein
VLAAAAGCGGGEGVATGATVAAYVDTPLCAGAERELAHEHGRAGDVNVRVVCLPGVRQHGRMNLATVGANARRATEDSSAVGYIGELDPAVTRFSRPILEAAGIPQLSNRSGAAAMAQLLNAIDEAGESANLREAVSKSLGDE